MSTKALLAAVGEIDFLDLSENFLDADGARAFSEFLSTNKTLKVLKINGCKLGDKTLEMMLEALSKNPSLQLSELHMARNDFSDSDLLSVITSKFKVLEVLDISDNKFTDLILPKTIRSLNVGGMKDLDIE